jgi:hypothetical protein
MDGGHHATGESVRHQDNSHGIDRFPAPFLQSLNEPAFPLVFFPTYRAIR